MNTKSTKKAPGSAKPRNTTNALILKGLPLELLTPEQYEAITKANYHHPESRLILQLFLSTNYTWQLARKILQKPSAIDTVDWFSIEKSSAKLINETLQKLLKGVVVEAPAPVEAARPRPKKVRQSCGCSTPHSNAAGVVDACKLGKEGGPKVAWY